MSTELTPDPRPEAKRAFNACWDLLDNERRTIDQDADLLAAAFASRYHWAAAGDVQAMITAEWMVSRAAAAIGEGPLSVRFAKRAADLLEVDVQPAWLRASVFEGLARAYAAAGDPARRQASLDLALSELAAEEDVQDRALIAEQIATVPSV